MRPLRWHDLPFAYRLAGRGTSFDAHLRLIVGENHFRHLQLTGLGRTPVYVLRGDNGPGLGSLHYPASGQRARLAYLAPSLENGADEDLWLRLLDGLVEMAGQRGTINLTAEVDELSPALEILRRADFAIYARQNIWLREPQPIDGPVASLREAASDSMAIESLYRGLVPGLIRQVEPSLAACDACYVVAEGNDPSAVVAVYGGSSRALVELYLHPQISHETEAIINGALATMRGEKHPIYFRVRRYMGWLDTSLEDANFSLIASQALMVRHMTVNLRLKDALRSPVRNGLAATNPVSEISKQGVKSPHT